MWTWLKENADPAMVVITTLGFAFTVWQLQQANTALKASNGYEVQKDAREYIKEILSDASFREVLNGMKQADSNSQEKLWLMFNFYRSVHREEKAGVLTDEFTAAIHEDFCDFLKLQPVAEGWKKLLTEGRVGDGHSSMRKEWCGT